MPSDNTDALVAEIHDILTNFVTELNDALNGEAQAVERVIRGDEELSRATLNSEPEDWTEDVLIDELIAALGLNKRPGRPNPRYETPDWQNVEIPDFELVEHDDADDPGHADLWIIGENKSVNRISAAQTDMQGYLSKMWWPNYGIATDGITWEAYRIEATNNGDNDTTAGDTGQHYRSYTKTVDLRDAIRTIAEEEGAVGQRQLNGSADVDAEIRAFIDVFASDALIDLLKRRAPKELRDQRKNDVDTTGYYGNIITLRVAYEKDASPVRDIYEAELADSKLACFTRRPKCVFEDLQVRAGIITGQKHPNSDTPPIRTSRFIRFDDGNRADRIGDISYAPTEGLHLGETRIGSGENYSIPKLGTSTARRIIKKLKLHSGATVGERMRDDTTTQHVMWRRRGAGYWLNPMLENLYNDIGKDTPTSMYKMYFDTDLERRAAFLIQQSSLYYHYWMVYKNGRNIDWWEIKPFPMPTDEQLKEHKDEIIGHSDELWSEMDARFVGGMRTVFENAAELKPIVDDVDDLLGPLYDLSEDEIEYLKEFDTEYGRAP